MQFQLPQFIEVEDTIFGPLTFKQFLYLAGGAGLAFICYVYLPIYLAIFPIIGVIALSTLLAFYKYNGRNFVYIVESATKFFFSSKLYLWKQTLAGESKRTVVVKEEKSAPEGINLPRLSASKLKDLTWSLDVQNSPEAEQQNNYGT